MNLFIYGHFSVLGYRFALTISIISPIIIDTCLLVCKCLFIVKLGDLMAIFAEISQMGVIYIETILAFIWAYARAKCIPGHHNHYHILLMVTCCVMISAMTIVFTL